MVLEVETENEGLRARVKRTALRLSQTALAMACHVRQYEVSRLERNITIGSKSKTKILKFLQLTDAE